MKKIIIASVFLVFVAIFLSTCVKDVGELDYQGYPPEIGKILVNKCAIPGCHNSISKDACGGLDLTTWEKMFEGGTGNSVVIPYRPDQSILFFAVNTFTDLGPALSPTMPLNKDALSREDVMLIRDWIADGAPDKNGFVKWSDNPNRKKVYVANQGCDMISVFDTKTKLYMRCIDVGNTGGTEAPHDMYVSPDGQHLYVSFFASNIFQKYKTSDDVKVGELVFPTAAWHSMAISGNSQYALVSHLDGDGIVSYVNLSTMTIIQNYSGMGFLVYPHGCTLNYNGTLGYITSQQGNFIYKIDMTSPSSPDVSQIPLQTGDLPSYSGIYKAYEVDFTPDYSKYYVSCQGTNEVRIFSAANDSLLSVVPSIGVPQTISFSENHPYAFVACMADSANPASQTGVTIINSNTMQQIGSLNTGPQPRGLVVDDENDCVWVANRNINPTGWAPHHTTICAGRPGYVTIIDMSTLQMIPGWRTQVTVDPYQVAIRK